MFAKVRTRNKLSKLIEGYLSKKLFYYKEFVTFVFIHANLKENEVAKSITFKLSRSRQNEQREMTKLAFFPRKFKSKNHIKTVFNNFAIFFKYTITYRYFFILIDCRLKK